MDDYFHSFSCKEVSRDMGADISGVNLTNKYNNVNILQAKLDIVVTATVLLVRAIFSDLRESTCDSKSPWVGILPSTSINIAMGVQSIGWVKTTVQSRHMYRRYRYFPTTFFNVKICQSADQAYREANN